MKDYLDALSEFVASVRYSDLREDTVVAVKDVILDTLGAIVAGSRLPENANLAALMARQSTTATSTIFGHRFKTEPMLAAMINGTAGVSLEIDEGNRFGGGHPAIHCIPGAIAVAEELRSDGPRLIESILAGYEIESRMGAATRLRSNVHSHGNWGAIGTAVAVAKLRDYGQDQIREVINLAASMSPANAWTPAFKGATVRNLYSGRSGLQGILAIHVYESGFTGIDDGPADVFGTIIGDQFDAGVAIKDLNSDYRIEKNYFKFYACCRLNHPSLEAVLGIRQHDDFAIEDIAAIEIATRSMLAGMLGEYPTNMLSAKFNVPYAVAASLVRNSADVNTFNSSTIGDARVRMLADKVHITVDPDLSGGPEEGPLVRATIRLKDGRSLEGDSSIVMGDYGNRVPREEILGKFRALNNDILGRELVDSAINAVGGLEQLSDIREMTGLLGGKAEAIPSDQVADSNTAATP